MSYYKYSNNELLEEGIPYNGIFRVENGIFLKGYSENSTLSASDNIFINDIYIKNKNFSNTFNNIENIDKLQISPFDVIDKQYFDKIFDTLNNNNTVIYKSLVTINPFIFEKDNVKFYTLSSTQNPIILSETITHSDPFDNNVVWGFLDHIVAGELLPTSSNTFKYLCSDGKRLLSIAGNFDQTDISITTEFDIEFSREIQNISYSEKDERLYILSDDQILIYDGLLYKNCDTLILIDSIKLEDVDTEIYKWTSKIKFRDAFGKFSQKYVKGNPNNPDFIKFGNKNRTCIDNGFLFICDKYSNNVIESVDLRNYGITDLLTLDVNKIDDRIAILHKKFNDDIGIYISYYNKGDVSTSKLENFKESVKYHVRFSQFDSDLIFTINDNEYQIRSIENSEYILGGLNESTLKYLPKFKFGDTFRKFGNPEIKWSSNNSKSNNFNHIFSNEIVIGDISYHVLISTGRFYVIKQKITDFYQYKINRLLTKNAKTPVCGENSFGLYLNDNIYSILKDLSILQNQAECKYSFEKNDTVMTEIENLLFENKNLFLNTNEKLHAANLQRIFDNIIKLQSQMLSISSSQV
jgi:hypothetical protein